MGLFRHASAGIPALVPIPPIAELPQAKMQSSARYLGTFTIPADKATKGERVIGHSLSARSAARLSLSTEALDVVRIAGSFRIGVDALRGARTEERFNGKPITDLLVIRWEHEGLYWETGFRLDPAKSVRDAAKAQLGRGATSARADAGAWVRTISKMVREAKKGTV